MTEDHGRTGGRVSDVVCRVWEMSVKGGKGGC